MGQPHPIPDPSANRTVVVYGPENAQVRFNYGGHEFIAVDTVDAGRYVFLDIPVFDALNVFIEHLGEKDKPVDGYAFYGIALLAPSLKQNEWFAVRVDVSHNPTWYQLPVIEKIATLGELTTRGHLLQYEDGRAFTVKGNSEFNLLAVFQESGEAGITPVLTQLQRLKRNWIRVWTLYDNIPRIGTLNPCPYDLIPAFVKICARFGIHVQFTAYTGVNDPAHWGNLIAAALLCKPRPVLDYVNELNQNFHEPDELGRYMSADVDSDGGMHDPYIVSNGGFITHHDEAPAALISGHGSNGSESWPVLPHWRVAFFHTNGAFEEQRKTGHNAREVFSGPTVLDEMSRCPDQYSNPEFMRDCSAGSTQQCAGHVVHSVHGKLGQELDEVEEACTLAATEAADDLMLDPEQRYGPYTHRLDLENRPDQPNYDPHSITWLRVYQVGNTFVYIHRTEDY